MTYMGPMVCMSHREYRYISLTITDGLEEQILDEWEQQDDEEIRRYSEIGKAWNYRHKHPPPPPVMDGGHLYQDPGTKPPPTKGDIAQIKNDLQHISAHWRFERTVYENSHHSHFHRIIHLFAGIDDYGVVKQVSVHSDGSLSVTQAHDFESG